jgi:HAD superfamily hydrolase (TIGR01509 family)
MPPRLVLFDMDDVLCAYHVEARIAHLSDVSGRSPAEIREAIWDSGFLDEADRGRWDADGTLAEFGRRLGYPLTRDEWIEARRRAMPPFADVLALVGRLKPQATVAVLTNNDPLVEETLPLLFPALPGLFGPHLYVSSRFGVSKPDPDVFRACCEAIGIAPGEAFFTDDKAENVAGARAAGLRGHVFAGASGLQAALREAGLDV